MPIKTCYDRLPQPGSVTTVWATTARKSATPMSLLCYRKQRIPQQYAVALV